MEASSELNALLGRTTDLAARARRNLIVRMGGRIFGIVASSVLWKWLADRHRTWDSANTECWYRQRKRSVQAARPRPK